VLCPHQVDRANPRHQGPNPSGEEFRSNLCFWTSIITRSSKCHTSSQLVFSRPNASNIRFHLCATFEGVSSQHIPSACFADQRLLPLALLTLPYHYGGLLGFPMPTHTYSSEKFCEDIRLPSYVLFPRAAFLLSFLEPKTDWR